MGTTREIVEIAASPEQVFPYLIEPEKLLRVMEGLKEVNATQATAPNVVAHLTLVFDVRGRRYEVESETTRIERNQLLEGRTFARGWETLGVQELVAIDGGTRLTTTCSNRYDSFLLRIVSPFTEWKGGRTLRRNPLGLKRVIEAEVSGTPDS
jgi:uncharacterized protein YndB with AHSA1/START domain